MDAHTRAALCRLDCKLAHASTMRDPKCAGQEAIEMAQLSREEQKRSRSLLASTALVLLFELQWFLVIEEQREPRRLAYDDAYRAMFM